LVGMVKAKVRNSKASKEGLVAAVLKQVKELKQRRADLQAQLSELQAEIEIIDELLGEVGRELGAGDGDGHPGQTRQRIGNRTITLGSNKGTPKANKKLNKTEQVLAAITEEMTAADVIKKLGWPKSQRRPVYDIMKKEGYKKNGRIVATTMGAFEPR
jgi:Tfp pilus assembly protein FimV